MRFCTSRSHCWLTSDSGACQQKRVILNDKNGELLAIFVNAIAKYNGKVYACQPDLPGEPAQE